MQHTEQFRYNGALKSAPVYSVKFSFNEIHQNRYTVNRNFSII